ncbi:hypothetical protein ACET3Z_025332 [Daucus carota]
MNYLNESRYDWTIGVRAQAIWQGVNMLNKEFRGLNILFVDDVNHRIHAFIAVTLSEQFKNLFKEGSIYQISNFSVKLYHGDETYRAVKNVKHIYFNNDTTCTKLTETALKIQPLSFDFLCLDDVENLKKDNRFLIDVVGVIDGQPVKTNYNKDDVDRSMVKFGVTDGKYYAIFTFFNELGATLLKALEQKLQNPVIIIIASAKIIEWKDEVGLTNYPVTRFYLNCKHHVVKTIRGSIAASTFYVTNVVEEDEKEIPKFTVKQKSVDVRMTMQKIGKTMTWYCNYCIPCDVDLRLVEKRFKYPKHGKFKPYPDRRYKFCMLCSDETGSIPVLWSAEELTHATGKTVYDVLVDESQVGDGDKFPPILQQFEKKCYTFTLLVSKENVLQGSNVYTTVTVSDAKEISGHHNSADNISAEIKQTKISQDTNVIKSSSPPTGESTTKTRARKTTDAIELQLPQKTPHRRVKHVKMEPNVRMQAFVPTFLTEKLLKIFFVGRMYTITNFQVKEYTKLDKWRYVTTDKQLMFTNQTRAKEMDEREYFIPQKCFDFCDFGDVKNFVKQSTYLADVVGVVTRRDDLKIVHTKEGTDKPQIRMTISDGRSGQPQFKMQQDRIVQAKKEPTLMTIDAITQLGEDYIEEEVKCQIQITAVQDSDRCFYSECTSFYKQVQGKFPSQFKNMENGKYTVKLQIREFNIKDKDEVYLETDIYEGFSIPPQMKQTNYGAQQATESSIVESAGNSIHLDTLGN